MAEKVENIAIRVRPDAKLMDEIEARKENVWHGARSQVAMRDLARYYHLLQIARHRLAQEGVFSPDEQALIIDALNGVLLGEHITTLPANVEATISLDGLAEKWGVDGAALMEKLRSLSPLELAAIADAVEMFWAAVARGEDRDARGELF